ncbi:hypothetical protein [Mycobacterium sp. pW045]|uniref:hypothetical protein n=1 Tax=Mycobacterium sp. pW045 TaxID=3238984 RepID=UPI00351B58F9
MAALSDRLANTARQTNAALTRSPHDNGRISRALVQASCATRDYAEVIVPVSAGLLADTAGYSLNSKAAATGMGVRMEPVVKVMIDR